MADKKFSGASASDIQEASNNYGFTFKEIGNWKVKTNDREAPTRGKVEFKGKDVVELDRAIEGMDSFSVEQIKGKDCLVHVNDMNAEHQVVIYDPDEGKIFESEWLNINHTTSVTDIHGETHEVDFDDYHFENGHLYVNDKEVI